jgi:hypothetical protein
LWDAQGTDLSADTAAKVLSAGLVAARLGGGSASYWGEAALGSADVPEAAPALAGNLAQYLLDRGRQGDADRARRIVSEALEEMEPRSPVRADLAAQFARTWPDQPVPRVARVAWRPATSIIAHAADREVRVPIPSPEEDVRRLLGDGLEVPVPGSATLRSLYYPDLGLRFYCGRDGAFMAMLSRDTAAVPVRSMRMGAEEVLLRVGATREWITRLFGNWRFTPMNVTGDHFIYFDEPNVGLCYADNTQTARVTQLAVLLRADASEE